jgi:hypothetical protein
MNEIKFSCSHDVLVQKWNQDGYQDYELIPTEGTCGFCYSKSVKVLTQIGAERFGVHAGFCLSCINAFIPDDASPLDFAVECTNSEDMHNIRVDSERLEIFLKNPKIGEFLSEQEISDLSQAVKRNKDNPALQFARECRKKPHQCKNCFGYILEDVSFEEFCKSRSNKNYIVSCFGCSALLARSKGCSMLTCPDTQCSNRICAFCLDGASDSKDLQHDISNCSQNISKQYSPPIPRRCTCPNEND